MCRMGQRTYSCRWANERGSLRRTRYSGTVTPNGVTALGRALQSMPSFVDRQLVSTYGSRPARWHYGQAPWVQEQIVGRKSGAARFRFAQAGV